MDEMPTPVVTPAEAEKSVIGSAPYIADRIVSSFNSVASWGSARLGGFVPVPGEWSRCGPRLKELALSIANEKLKEAGWPLALGEEAVVRVSNERFCILERV